MNDQPNEEPELGIIMPKLDFIDQESRSIQPVENPLEFMDLAKIPCKMQRNLF